MTGDMSFFSLVMQAGFIVKLVMLMLLAASVASWAIIMRKRTLIKDAISNSDEFETSFWSGGDLTGIYRELTSKGEAPSDMAGIFEALWVTIRDGFTFAFNIFDTLLAGVPSECVLLGCGAFLD